MGQTHRRNDTVTGGEVEVGAGESPQPIRPAAVPPSTTIHEAELAGGPSGAVEYGAEIDEVTAIARRGNGDDIVVRGGDTKANRARAYQIEVQVGPPSKP